jgi:CheY-like chemotaxis protein
MGSARFLQIRGVSTQDYAPRIPTIAEGPAKTADRNDVDQRVLVIEDSPSVRRLIEVCLRVLDVNVSSAIDGITGLAQIGATDPDVVVLDIGLPGLDGWEVLSRLRENPNSSDVKVLVLTAHAQPEMADRAAEGGADAFMTKPFRPIDLRVQVEKLLAS